MPAKPPIAPLLDPEPVSVQVFLDSSVAPEAIADHLQARLVSLSEVGLKAAGSVQGQRSLRERQGLAMATACKTAKLGKVSRLARSINLKAAPAVVDFINSLPEVVEILPENVTDWYPKPVHSKLVTAPPKSDD